MTAVRDTSFQHSIAINTTSINTMLSKSTLVFLGLDVSVVNKYFRKRTFKCLIE